MDQSTQRLPDPDAGASHTERRRSIRHKLHTPVYASFNGPQTGMVVDLSELLDLHEEGFAVQTSEPLEVNRPVAICLDLPETRSFIHGRGQVIWSDHTGRGGIQLSGLPESSRHILQEWLFANLLIACSNHAARAEQLARREKEKSPELVRVPSPATLQIDESDESNRVIPIQRVETGMPSSQTRQDGSLRLEAVRLEVSKIGDDEVLQLVTECAVTLTGATGAALAFLTGDKMICRAQAGNPAPPLGAPVDAKQGLSGECIRTGLLVSCEDMENDPRVDPEIGRALGIGSLMAAPIIADSRVIGLLEVFSPHPWAFTEAHATVLGRLVEMIPAADREKAQPAVAQPEETRPETQPIEPPAFSGVFQTSASELAPIESLSIDPTSLDLTSIDPVSVNPPSMHAIRDALWETSAAVPEPVPQQVSEPLAAEKVPEPVPEQVPETSSLVPRLLHRALLGLVIVVVAIAVGYLVGPSIEKRWAPSQKASETALGQSATGHSAQPKSLAELRRLAEEGDGDAQWQLGLRYHNGEDLPHDDAQAMQWFLRAAEHGVVSAQSTVGAYYWAGRGVPEDLSNAYFWSTIANAQGDEASKIRLEVLASRMTRSQISTARQQADAWIHNYYQRAKSEAN
ncbi:MAG: GAF domain-containing protein [Terriglobales bacterium]|jgi:hypothetical protein